MKYSELKALFHNHFEKKFRKELGYKKDDGPGSFGFLFKDTHFQKTISCLMVKYDDFQYLQIVHVGLSFLPLENILTPLLYENGILGTHGKNTNIRLPATLSISQSISQDLNQYQILHKMKTNIHDFAIRIYNLEDAYHFFQGFSDFFEQDAAPFFEKWNDMRLLLPYLEKPNWRAYVPQENWKYPEWELEVIYSAKAISTILNGDSDWRFRKAIIWKLFNREGWRHYIDNLIKYYEFKTIQLPEEKSFFQQLNISKSLKEILAKTPPLYEWDDKYLEYT